MNATRINRHDDEYTSNREAQDAWEGEKGYPIERQYEGALYIKTGPRARWVPIEHYYGGEEHDAEVSR